MVKKDIEQKEVSSDVFIQGVYDNIGIVPNVTKAQIAFNILVDALKAGKYYVLKEGYTRNSLYQLIKKVETKAGFKPVFASTKNGQFVLYVKKE